MDPVQQKFVDLQHHTSYGGTQPILKSLRESDSHVSLEHVKDQLSFLDSYTKHKVFKRRFPRLPVWAPYQGYRVEVDLLSMSRYAGDNNNVHYLLNMVDQFSRMAYCEPLKSKSPEEVCMALRKIWDRVPFTIQSVYADNGTEWRGAVKTFFQKHHCTFIVATSWVKASIVERFQKTLKVRLTKYMRQQHSYRYVNALQTIVNNINNSVNKGIATTPASVNIYNQHVLYGRLRGKWLNASKFKRSSARFAVGDHVIAGYKTKTFRRGYEQNYTDEVFTIDYVYPSHPPTFRLKDRSDRELPRKYYGSELQRVRFDDNYVYDLEIRGRRGKGKTAETLVHFLTEPDDKEEWIKSSSLITHINSVQVGPTRKK